MVTDDIAHVSEPPSGPRSIALGTCGVCETLHRKCSRQDWTETVPWTEVAKYPCCPHCFYGCNRETWADEPCAHPHSDPCTQPGCPGGEKVNG